MKSRKKIISLILCLSLVLGNVAVFASEANPTANTKVSVDTKSTTDTEGVVEERGVGTLVTAGGWALADGPLPIGDMIAGGLIVFEAGKLVVDHAPALFEWIMDFISEVLNSDKVKDGDEVKVKFPETPGEMNDLTGVSGQRVLDTPSTPGRRKTEWKLPNGNKVTNERHPYGVGYPASHTGWHWHVETPTGRSTGYLAGQNIPNVLWDGLD